MSRASTYLGRKPIYTNEKEITASNISKVLEKALAVHNENKAEIEYLQKYEKGRQDILDRVKEVRPEINNKIVENHAAEITSFKVGYVFGSPVTYVQRASEDMKGDEKKDDRRISLLNEMFFEEGKAGKDQQIARDFNICGVGYRLILPRKVQDGVSPFELMALDPKTTFVVYSMDVYHRPMMGVSYYIDDDNEAHYGAYTEDRYFELSGDENGVINDSVDEKLNGIGMIPIIEYKNDYDRMGCFERVLPLLDALNEATSDRLNAIAQFVQSFIWFSNCEIDDEQSKKLSNGMIMTKSVDGQQANITYITAELNQTEAQALAEYLYDQILQIAGVPGRESNTGGDTGNAVVLRNGWAIAETAARSTELLFAEGERELLKVALQIIRRNDDEDVDMGDLTVSDIEVKFSRNRTDGLLVKTQALSNMMSAGIHPLKCLEAVGIFSDPQQVWMDSKPYIEKLNSAGEQGNKQEDPIKDPGLEQQEIAGNK